MDKDLEYLNSKGQLTCKPYVPCTRKIENDNEGIIDWDNPSKKIIQDGRKMGKRLARDAWKI